MQIVIAAFKVDILTYHIKYENPESYWYIFIAFMPKKETGYAIFSGLKMVNHMAMENYVSTGS